MIQINSYFIKVLIFNIRPKLNGKFHVTLLIVKIYSFNILKTMELPEMISEMKPFDTENEITIGVLAVQGSFYEHIDAITRLKSDVYAKNENGLKNERLKIKVIDIRSSQDVSPNMRGLIIPGIVKFDVNKDYGFFSSFQNHLSFHYFLFRRRVNNA